MWRWLTQRRPAVQAMPARNAEPAAQEVAAHYRIERRIGRGAAAQVFLAQDRRTGRWVALKLLDLGANPASPEGHDALERFRREAMVLHGLHHPGIVQVLDAGASERGAWMALEVVAGCDLGRYTRPARLLPPQCVARTGARIADALHHAHKQGVIHRDVKPANVLVDWAADVVKLGDFGLARMSEHTQTRSGVTLGSPDYMAPEQLAGGAVGHAADVYGLGATLYELLCGQRPHQADNLGALLRAVATEPAADLMALRPDLDPALAAVVMQALAKAPAARPADAAQMRERLLVCAGIGGAPRAASP
jgi:serine/threonine protein kinase